MEPIVGDTQAEETTKETRQFFGYLCESERKYAAAVDANYLSTVQKDAITPHMISVLGEESERVRSVY